MSANPTAPKAPIESGGADVPRQLRSAIGILEAVARDRSLLAELSKEDRARLQRAAGQVYCPDPSERRRLLKASQRRVKTRRRERDEAVLQESGIRELRRKPVFITPNVFPPEESVGENGRLNAAEREVVDPQCCYTCKNEYSSIHHFYDQLCPACADLNFRKRTESADLNGRVALLTGGRVKIGYQAGIKLLRAGAQLIVATRFPRDAAARYARETDFEVWQDRLKIFGLDLRHTPSVEGFCRHLLATQKRLDFIINNACQTVRRPSEYYAHMMESETASLKQLPEESRHLLGRFEGVRGYDILSKSGAAPNEHLLMGLPAAAGATQTLQQTTIPDELAAEHPLFPEGRLDQDLQQVDLRERNSWRLTLAEVSSVELLEVHLVNAVAPFILNARLKPLMLGTPERDKHIVNVSAVEGQFYRKFKTTRHPHTNMAKAALNMMTRTSAADYHADGIHMNSVDTGWVTDEDPAAIASRKVREQGFHPPLDIVDGAARIVDPIISGFNTGDHIWGKFLKDYVPTDW